VLQISTRTAAIALLVATAIVVLLAFVAVMRRTSFVSRAGRIFLSLFISVGIYFPATVLFEKMNSASPGFRVHIGDESFATTWDLILTIGSTWIAVCVGWLVAKWLGARQPLDWPSVVARARDIGLIALFAAMVVLLFAANTGPILRSFESPLNLNLWGVWALGQTVPIVRFLVRRMRKPHLPVPSGKGSGRLDRVGRLYLTGYYWYVAVALPFSLWGFSVLEREFQD
jgi:hypothetical protein